MKNKIKIIGGIIIVVVIILIVYSQFGSVKNGSTTIGTIIPLTGNIAFIGEDLKKGLDLALANNPEVINYYEDNKGVIKDAVTAYQKLQSTVKPDIIISAGIGDLAIIPLAEKDHTPLMLTSASASGLPALGEYIFRYFTNADLDAPTIANYAITKLGLKKISVLYLQDQFGIDYKDRFSEEIVRNGGQITGTESFQYSDFDFKTQLSKLKKTDFDAIYLIGLDYQLVTAIRQIKELGIDKQILALGTLATRDAIEKGGSTVEGIYVTAFCVDGMPQGFVNEFQTKYSSYPGFYAEIGYDIGKIIIASVKDKGTGRENIKNGLSVIKDFPTNTGLVSVDKDGEIVIPVCVKKITNGKILNLSTGNYSDF